MGAAASPSPDSSTSVIPDSGPDTLPPAPTVPLSPAGGFDPTIPLVGSMTATLAGAVLTGLGSRRGAVLGHRPLGRRYVTPSVIDERFETALGIRASGAVGDGFERAARAVGAHCRSANVTPPALTRAEVSANQVRFVFADQVQTPPSRFTAVPDGWSVDPHDLPPTSGPHAYPACVTLGTDDAGHQVLLDLESVRSLHVDAGRPELALDVVSTLGLELASHPWANEIDIVLVGGDPSFLTVASREPVHSVTVPQGIELLESAATARRLQLEPTSDARLLRCDPDRSESWAATIFCFLAPVTAEVEARIGAALDGRATGISALLLGDSAPRWTVTEGLRPKGTLEPGGLRVHAQVIPTLARLAISSLFTVADAAATTPAPWWFDPGEGATALRIRATEPPPVTDHPTLRIIGPIELRGARGEEPPRNRRQCEEYCGWLLEHPGLTASAMADALLVAEGTRRSTMSRLRTWLGRDSDGALYLPDAYNGRIRLHSGVSSDWQRLQILVQPGVNRLEEHTLVTALELIGGAPLADAAPGQWNWAEAVRADIAATLRDVGAVLTRRALHRGDLDLARWAATRALIASPDDEELIRWRIRTEHRAGNGAEVERLVFRVTRHARSLGVDLDDETVAVCQTAMEGRVRARA
jgi:hypothetical protein